MGMLNIVVLLQLPVVAIIIVLSYQAYKSFEIPEFKLIGWGWVLNFIYLLVLFFKAQLTELISTNGGNEDLIEMSKSILDFSYLYLFFIGANYSKYTGNDAVLKLSRKLTSKRNMRIFVFIFIFILLFVRLWLSKNSNISSFYLNIPFVFVGILFLYSLGMFFLSLDKKYCTKSFHFSSGKESIFYYLTFGIAIYTVIQLLGIFKNTNNDFLTVVYELGFPMGFVSKVFILYGLHNLFIFYAVKSKASEKFAKRLDSILGRTFHEIIRPINSLDLSLETLINKDDGVIVYNKKAKEEILKSDDCNNRLIAIVGASIRLYDPKLAKELHEAKGQLPKSISLNTLAEIAIMMVKNSISDEEELKYSIIPQYTRECDIVCVQSEIIQALSNIIKNSIEALPDVKGKIRIKTYKRTNDDDPDKKFKEVIIDICDNGSGISEDIKADIFKFGESTRNRFIKGNGLPISKEKIEKNSGKITIDSPYFKDDMKFNGTQVRIVFPKSVIKL